MASGKVVTTSEKSINFNGWKGSGYIIIDPNTGSGAYIISGGLNGGVIPPVGEFPIGMGLLIGLVQGASPALVAAMLMSGPMAIFIAVLAFVAIQIFKYNSFNSTDSFDFDAARFLGILAGLVLGVIVFSPGLLTLGPLFLIGLIYLIGSMMTHIAIAILTNDNRRRSINEYYLIG